MAQKVWKIKMKNTALFGFIGPANIFFVRYEISLTWNEKKYDTEVYFLERTKINKNAIKKLLIILKFSNGTKIEGFKYLNLKRN